MKHYLVTGGTGFIGAAIVRGLVERGEKVRCLDNFSRGSIGNLAGLEDKIEMIKGDVRDPLTVVNACKGVDGVCHLAAVNGTEYFYSIPEVVLEVATKGMINIIDACLHYKINDLTVMSSSEVYQAASVIPTPEEIALVVPNPLNPRFSYGGGKIISELLAINYGRRHIKRTRIVRPHNVYGPRMGWEHVVPQLISRINEISQTQPEGTLKIPIQGTGQETRSFIFIDDMANGFLTVLDKGTANEIYHIGTEEEITIGSLALEIAKVMGRNIQLIPSSLAEGSTLRRCPSTQKIRSLGFKTKYSLAEGLYKTIHWYLDALKTQSPKRKSA